MKTSPPAWLALLLLFTPCLVQGQSAAPAPEEASDKQGDYTKIVDHFFEQVKAGEFTEAAHVLVDTNPQDAFNVEKHESVAVPLQKIQDAFGSFKDFKPLVTKTLGNSVGYIYGLAIYERGPIRFEFMFYKDGTSWRLLHIDFNLNYAPEIRELAGVHISAPVYVPAPAAQKATPSKSSTPDNPLPDNPAPPAPTPSNPATPTTAPATPPASSPPAATPPSSTPAPSPAPSP